MFKCTLTNHTQRLLLRSLLRFGPAPLCRRLGRSSGRRTARDGHRFNARSCRHLGLHSRSSRFVATLVHESNKDRPDATRDEIEQPFRNRQHANVGRGQDDSEVFHYPLSIDEWI